jgi:hypothetical protein
MAGIETVESLNQRVATVEAHAADPEQSVQEARSAMADALTELDRDRADLKKARSEFSARHWELTTLLPWTDAAKFDKARVAPAVKEVNGDTSAIARLSRALNRINDRIQGASYEPVTTRTDAIRNAGIYEPIASVLAAAPEPAEQISAYQTYRKARSELADPALATVLAIENAGTRGPVNELVDTYLAARDKELTPLAAALGSTSSHTAAEAFGYKQLTASGIDQISAELLASSTRPADARKSYDVLVKQMPAWRAAMLASVAAFKGASTDDALATYTKLRDQLPDDQRDEAAHLTAALLCMDKASPDAIVAARAHFKALAPTLAWAFNGVPSEDALGITVRRDRHPLAIMSAELLREHQAAEADAQQQQLLTVAAAAAASS